MKRGACLCICSPLGRSPMPGLKSSKQSPLTSQKPGSSACSFPLFFIHCLRLSNSFLCLFATLYLSTELERCSSMAVGPVIPAPVPPASSSLPPWLALAPHTDIPPPPPTLGEMLPWIGCRAVESQPLMGSGRESESERGGRREENPAEKE